MSKKRKSSFRGKVAQNSQKEGKSGVDFSYLNLPKGVELLKIQPGIIYMDIIPYEVTDSKHPDRDESQEIAMVGDLWYKRPFRVHRNVGAMNETVLCPQSFGKRCPICEKRAEMAREGVDKEELKPLNSSHRNLYAVMPLDYEDSDHDLDETIHILDISSFCFQELLKEELEEDEDNEIFPDLEEGLTLKVRFKEDNFAGNKFPKASKITFKKRDEQYGDDVLKDVPNLDELFKLLTYKELEAKFLEIDEEDYNEDEPEQEEPKRRKKRAVVEEDENEDAPEPEEEEKEEPKQNRKRRKAEVEQKDDEDDEPEEKPTPKKSKEKDGKNKCPFGHKFGADWGDKDDCDECDKFDDCMEENENM